MNLTNQSPPRDERWLWLLFAGAWLLHFTFSLAGWDNTLLNRLQFRQLQTAITTLFFPADGFRFDYETPLFGPPWAIPLEFPVFQATVAWFSAATGMKLDAAGRLVSWLFFQFSLPAFYLLLGSLGVRRPLRLLCLSLLVTSPIYLFFSRAFLIESTVLCFSAWFLAAFARWITTARPAWLLVSMLTGALAATVKLTTMTSFCVAAALFSAGFWWQARRDQPDRARPLGLRILLLSAAAALVPIVAGLAWLAYSTGVRQRNPEADILNTVFGFWSFGDLAQRLSLDYWVRTLSVWTGGLVGEGGLVLGVFLFARQRTRFRLPVMGLFAAFLSGQLIFSNLYYVHDYYFYACGVFLILALGLLLCALFEDETMPRWSRWSLPILVILLQLATYSRTYLPPQSANTEVPEMTRVVHDLTRPDDMIVVLGQDWDGAIPYYAQRRALMLRAGSERDPAAIARSIARLDPGKVGAVLLFGHLRNDSTFVQQTMSRLNLGATPLLLSHPLQLGLWIPEGRRPEVMDKLPSHTYTTLDLVPKLPPAGASYTLGQHEINQLRAFDALSPKPVRATSVAGFSNSIVDNVNVLNTHAPCALTFHTPRGGLRTLRAVFGIHHGAYTDPHKQTDGVEFTVALLAPGQPEQILFSRLLDPSHQAGDQGTQHLEVKLESPLTGEIVIHVRPGPQGNNSFDWAYLGQVELR